MKSTRNFGHMLFPPLPTRLIIVLFCGLTAVYGWQLLPDVDSAFKSYPKSLDKCNLNHRKQNDHAPEQDWFGRQRAYPRSSVPTAMALAGLKEASEDRGGQGGRNSGWVFQGPLNTGGRITCISVDPDSEDGLLVGSASGGMFKSTDGGNTWASVLDEAASLSIGDIARAPSNPDVIYVGTGEPNAGGGSIAYDGNGIWRTDDGGDNWTAAGLENMGSTGKLAVDPIDPNVVYAAMMGDLFSNNSNRGLYKSTDGGNTWDQVHFVNDSTGFIDVEVRPDDPNTVFAASWQRVRRPNYRDYGGSGSSIWKSTDAGLTWTEVAGGLPGGADKGRIAFAISPANYDRMYALYMDRTGSYRGFYRSADGGSSWSDVGPSSISGNFATYGWWFTQVYCHPSDPDQVTITGLSMRTSTNAGTGFPITAGPSVHVDQHAWVVHPLNENLIWIGNDGGLYRSTNAGGSYEHLENLPITQFYTTAIDASNADAYYGGTQDNGTIRTLTGSQTDWELIYGGDGFVVLIDPSDPSYVYAEFQYGGLSRSTNGGSTFGTATSGISFGDRFNWKCPLIMDPNTPSTLYFGTNRLYRSTDRASSWTAISDDLTKGDEPGNLAYNTLTTIAVSRLDPDVLWTGADDGSIHFSDDGGTNWNKIDAGLPERWVTNIEADPNSANGAIISLSGFRWHEEEAHIYRTTDRGLTWEPLMEGLPNLPVNDVLFDPADPDRIFAATDAGVYTSSDAGSHWQNLYEGLPSVVVTDLAFDGLEQRLVAATYGRGMYKLTLADLPSVVETATDPEIRWTSGPNPSTGLLKLDLSESHLTEGVAVYLVNASGQRQLLGNGVTACSTQFDLSHLPQGIYHIQLEYLKDQVSQVAERAWVIQR